MMDQLFSVVLDMTVTGSIVILAVLLLRLLLRRMPKVISYCLWLLVLFRLLCPWKLPSPMSILPELTPVAQTYDLQGADISIVDVSAAAIGSADDLVSGGTAVHQIPVRQPVQSQSPEEDPVNAPVVEQTPGYISATTTDIWILFGSYLWITGFSAMALYSIFSILRLKRKLREAIRLDQGVYQAENIDSPFVMGLIFPKIYIPVGMDGEERKLILAHEKQHIRRWDPLWKALGFLALSIHWFNPLVWLAFILACRDMEMSCDEAVVKRLGESVRGAYAAALLNIATGRRIISGSPLAFGEGDPKGRIRNLSKWRKPVLWITVAAVVVCAVVAVCLLTDPMGTETVGGGNSCFFGYLDVISQDQLILTCEDGRVIVFDRYAGFTLPENVSQGTYVMIRGSWREDSRRYIAGRVEMITGPVYGDLEEAIENAILLVEGAPKSSNQRGFASFVTIAHEPSARMAGDRSEGVVTYYGYALYQCYGNRNGKLQEVGGSHIPVAVTFRINSIGGYCLAEYWMPRDGSYCSEDIRNKFPGGQIPDGQEYIIFQQQECEAKAKRYFHIDQEEEPETSVPPTTGIVYGFDISKVPVDSSLPFEELPQDYGREDAIRDGVAVMEYESAYANADVWEAFIKDVAAGVPARVRVMSCAMGVRLRIEDILFDGKYFLVRCPVYYSDGRYSETFEYHYNYFATFNGSVKDDRGRVHEEYTRYGLSVWQPAGREPNWDLWHTGGDIMVFQYKTKYAINPEIPETLVSAKLMLEDLTMGTVNDPRTLESLRDMLAGAQYVPDGKAAYAMEELYLELVFSDGTRLRLSMFPEKDWIVMDGQVYDYGPYDTIKKDGDLNYVADYNALLDLVRHFGLEDWPEEFRQWCIDRGIEPPRHSLKVLVGEEPHG